MRRSQTIKRLVTLMMGVPIGLSVLTPGAFATTGANSESPSSAKFECSDSHHSNTDHGANNDDGYQSTCDPTDFGGNGQEFGPGLQTGKPCAGCVGNADDKNPPGQFPDGSDLNSGYECDGRDRPSANQQGNGNHGIGDENPAHTGCQRAAGVTEPPTVTKPPRVTPTTTLRPRVTPTSIVRPRVTPTSIVRPRVTPTTAPQARVTPTTTPRAPVLPFTPSPEVLPPPSPRIVRAPPVAAAPPTPAREVPTSLAFTGAGGVTHLLAVTGALLVLTGGFLLFATRRRLEI